MTRRWMARRSISAIVAALLVGCQAAPILTSSPTAPVGSQAPTSPPSPSPSATASLAPTPAPTPTTPRATASSDPRTIGWRADLESLVDIREDLHPEPWHAVTRDDYVAEVNATIARIPQLNDDQMLVELTRLAALPNSFGRDGHGGFFPWGEGEFGVNLFPLRLYWFSDGIFVTDALAPHEELIGARLEAINGHDVDELIAAVEPLVSRDNHQQVLASSPLLLLVANILHGLGFVPDSTSAVDFDLSRDEDEFSVALEPVSMSRMGSLLGGHYFWSVPSRAGGPLWLSNLEVELWWEVDTDSRTLYVGYNAVGARVYFAIDDLTAIVESGDVERLVVDVRHNGGGDNTTYSPLLDLVRVAADELPHGAYVAMSRATFSAAGNFVTEAERTTEAILVGEDLGTSPNQYGDGRATPLVHSGQVLRVAVRYTVKSTPEDERLTIAPDIPAPLSSRDYFDGRDPVLAAILGDAP